MAEGTPTVTPPDAPLTPQQLRGEVGLTRRRIGRHVDEIEQDVRARSKAVADALPYAVLSSVGGGSMLLAARRLVERFRRP